VKFQCFRRVETYKSFKRERPLVMCCFDTVAHPELTSEIAASMPLITEQNQVVKVR
jgi:hypothetical protein